MLLVCKDCLKGRHHENLYTECSKFGPISESGTFQDAKRKGRVRNSPFDLYKVTPPCGGGKTAVRPGFQTKTVYASRVTPMVLRAPHTNNIWRWTGLQATQLLSYSFIHSQLQSTSFSSHRPLECSSLNLKDSYQRVPYRAQQPTKQRDRIQFVVS
jgi:hypothetical protein